MQVRAGKTDKHPPLGRVGNAICTCRIRDVLIQTEPVDCMEIQSAVLYVSEHAKRTVRTDGYKVLPVKLELRSITRDKGRGRSTRKTGRSIDCKYVGRERDAAAAANLEVSSCEALSNIGDGQSSR